MVDVDIKPLDRNHGLRAFSCGEARIDNYLKNNSWKEHKNYKIRIFVATIPEQTEVIGYYSFTFIAWTIDEKMPIGTTKKFERIGTVPAIYLAKLGVTEASAKQGIGAQLMRDAFNRTLRISEHAGISTLTLEAISEEKAVWYEKLGLVRFEPGDLRMAIPLATIRKSVS